MGDAKVLGLSNWNDGVAINWEGKTTDGPSLAEWLSSVSDMLDFICLLNILVEKTGAWNKGESLEVTSIGWF